MATTRGLTPPDVAAANIARWKAGKFTESEKKAIADRLAAGSPSLRTKGMLVFADIRTWGATVEDKDLKVLVKEKKCEKSLATPDELKDWVTAITKLGRIITCFTAPTPEYGEGAMWVRSKVFMQLKKLVDETIAEADKAKHEFAKKYPGILAKGKERVGTGFSADDYPSPDEILKYFTISVEYKPVPGSEEEKADAERIAKKAKVVENIEIKFAEETAEETEQKLRDWAG